MENTKQSNKISTLPNFLSQNRFQLLSTNSSVNQQKNHNDHSPDFTKKTTPNKPTTETHNKLQQFKFKSLIVNLSKRSITETEKSVLELGLTFCPSQKNFNKEQLSTDFFHFIRRLKLREHFFRSPSSYDNENIRTDERSEHKWKASNKYWYPEELQINRSEGLLKFIDNVTKDLKKHLKTNEKKIWNNLNTDQCKALLDLSNDKSIVIKPADKGCAIVVMDPETYENHCLQTLSDPNFYEELPSDPNPSYRSQIDEIIDSLKDENIVNKLEADKMKEGCRTLCFYDLPKIHKDFVIFPPLRPICSGFNSCTAKISEFVDAFLKPLTQRLRVWVIRKR